MEPQRAPRELQLAEPERELEEASVRLTTLRRDMEHELYSRDPAATARYGSMQQETTVLRQRIAHLHTQLGDNNALARVRRQRSIQARHENRNVDAAIAGARARGVESSQASAAVLAEAEEMNLRADAALARARENESRARDANMRADAIASARARGVRDVNSRVDAAIAGARARAFGSSQESAAVLAEAEEMTLRADAALARARATRIEGDTDNRLDAALADVRQSLRDSRDLSSRTDTILAGMRADREARTAEQAAWRLEHEANYNDLQRRTRERAAEQAAWRLEHEANYNDLQRRARELFFGPMPADTHPARERAVDPNQAARAALRPWAAAASAEDERNTVPLDDEGQPIIPPGQECYICMARPRSVVFLPCGHAVTCAVCWNKMLGSTFAPECQLCKRPVEKAERLSPSQLQTLSDGGEIPHADIRRPDNNFIRLGASMH